MASASTPPPLPVLLRELEAVAYNLAHGRQQTIDAVALVRAVDACALRGGEPLINVLRTTAPRLVRSADARRQFFHAARALVASHREAAVRRVAAAE